MKWLFHSTPPPAEGLEKLETTPSEVQHKRELLRIKVTHSASVNRSFNLEAHVEQLLAQRRDTDGAIYVPTQKTNTAQ